VVTENWNLDYTISLREELVVKLILLSWRDIPAQEVSRLESGFSDEQLLHMIRNHGSANTN